MTADDVKFPGSDAYPKWLVPVALAPGILLFLRFGLWNDELLRGFVACLSASSVVIVFVTLRQWRTYVSLWIVLAIDTLAHSLLVAAIHGGDTHFPGIIFTPVVIVDFLFWQFIAVTCIRVLKF